MTALGINAWRKSDQPLGASIAIADSHALEGLLGLLGDSSTQLPLNKQAIGWSHLRLLQHKAGAVLRQRAQSAWIL